MAVTQLVGAPPARWIVSRRFDLCWFFGGALVTLLVAGLSLGAGVSITLLFWIWLLGVDGPHLFATLSRTYLDREEWQRRRALLLLSLGLFLLGPFCLVLDHYGGTQAAFNVFLALTTFYAYLHVVRQHYGFLALYKAANLETWNWFDYSLDKWCLYVGCWAPYFYFLISIPVARSILGLPPQAGAWEGPLGVLLLVAFGGAVGVFLVRNLLWRERINWPKVGYFLAVVPLFGLSYLWISRYEPVYANPQTPDQQVLLLSIMLSLTHGVQYVGLVWFHNKNRYGSTDSAARFGAASWFNRSPWRFAGVCLLFTGTFYAALSAATGVYPGLQLFGGARWGVFDVNQLGLALYWGLALHHYVLDQVIWRIKGDPALRDNLGLNRLVNR